MDQQHSTAFKSRRPIPRGLRGRMLVLAAAGLLTGAALCHAAGMVGKSAPPLAAIDLQQRPVSLAALRGQTVLVMFWATWCGPCRKEMPVVQAAYEKYGGKGFTVIAVNVSEEREAVEDYVKKMGVALPIVLDPEGDIAQRFAVMGVPTNYVVDPQGVVGEVIIGGKLTADGLDTIIGHYTSHN